MAISSIGSFQTGITNLGGMIDNTPHHSLVTDDATDVIDLSKTGDMTMAKGIEIKGINSTAPQDYFQVNINDDSLNQVNTSQFNYFLNHMEGLSGDEKASLQSAINAATDTLSSKQTQGDTYAMRIYQTNMELKYVSGKLVPEKYRDQFNSYADDISNQLSSNYVKLEKSMADDFAGRIDPTMVKLGLVDNWKKWDQSIEDGTDLFQKTGNQYKSLYDNIDVTDSSHVKKQMDSMFKSILSNSGSMSGDISNEIKYLSEKWNGLMDVMGEKNSKFMTSVNGLY